MNFNYHISITTEGNTYEFDLKAQGNDLSSRYEIIPTNEADLATIQNFFANAQLDGPLTVDTLKNRLTQLSPVLHVKITNLFSRHVQSPPPPLVLSEIQRHSSPSIISKPPLAPMTLEEKQLAVENGIIPSLQAPGAPLEATHITTRMAELGIPGVGIAVINNGTVEWTKGYGELEAPHVLSQVASTSKTVAALTMLSLIDQSQSLLSLDTDVSTILGKDLWESIDPDGLTKGEGNAVTIRHLLSHTAGMSVDGFSGYPKLEALDQEIMKLEEQLQNMKAKQPPLMEQTQSASEQTLPALDLARAMPKEERMSNRLDYLHLETGRGLRQMADIQQLQGQLNFLKEYRKTGKISTDDVILGKGNSDAVKVTSIPGSEFRYSGGGSTVLQKVIEVITGKSYGEVAQELVLDKLNMHNSTFSPDERHTISHGNDEQCKAIVGGSRYHPELAAAGLWTTPSDLAQVVIGIQRSLTGESGALVSPELAQQMLTPQTKDGWYGLGISIERDDESTLFAHGGVNEGYQCMYIGNDNGQGAVVMTNSDFGLSLIQEIIPSIAKAYNWPGKTNLAKIFPPIVPPDEMSSAEETRKMDPTEWVKDFSGEYFFEDHSVKVYENEGRIFIQADETPPFEIQPLTKNFACYRPSDPGPWSAIKFGTTEDSSKSLIIFNTEHKRRV